MGLADRTEPVNVLGASRKPNGFLDSVNRRCFEDAAPVPSLFTSFGWDFGEGRRRDSAGGQPGPDQVAERLSQASNGSPGATARMFSSDERAWREAERVEAKSAQARRRTEGPLVTAAPMLSLVANCR